MTENLATSFEELCGRFERRFEWLAVYPNGPSFAFQTSEAELSAERSAFYLSLPGERGTRKWRLRTIEFDREDTIVGLSGAFAKDELTVRLIPRTPASDLALEIEAARLRKVNEIARMAAASYAEDECRIVSARLNEPFGRLAQIVIANRKGKLSALIADVTETLTAERLLSSALIWQRELSERRRSPIFDIAIAAGKRRAKEIAQLVALFRDAAAARIEIFEIRDERLFSVGLPSGTALFAARTRRTPPRIDAQISDTARQIVSLAPDAVDVVRSAAGETLRFHGLPFARVRRFMDSEKCWFGTARRQAILTADNRYLLERLVADLSEHRRHDSENQRHEYYRSSPEAWLESKLKKNIKLLDANLELSPIYDQFRSEMRAIDLLALRRDGRLGIVEIKTSPDREMVLQAAGYWRRIEALRRKGEIERFGLFGDRKILDKPAIVYAVAPALSFHRDFDMFAGMLSPEIEIWRFELHEDWRREVKVIGRTNYLLR